MFCKVCAFLEFVHAGIDWIMGIKEPESGFIEYRLFCTSCHANDWPKKTLYRKSLCSINSEDGSLKLGVRELPTNLQTDMVYASKSTKICKAIIINDNFSRQEKSRSGNFDRFHTAFNLN